MKTIIFITSLLMVNAHAETLCQKSGETLIVTEDVNSLAPKGLEGAVIIVRRADGKETSVPIEKFKVVKRVQQFKTFQTTEMISCNTNTETIVKEMEKDNKNTVMVGGRRDYTTLDTNVSVDGKKATVSSKKDAVLDLSYLRRKLFDSPIDAGAGVDTNGAVRGIIGLDF